MNKTKLAISAKGNSLESEVSEVFARCPYFVIVEIEGQESVKTEAIKNENAGQTGGAGISAAKLMAEKDVSAVITGNAGPRALEILNQFNIAVYSVQGKIKDALDKFIEGKLEKIN